MIADALDVRLLNDFQSDFPLCPAPFAELASRLGVAESAVLRILERLRREGKVARVGAVFAPKRIGASLLAAMAVPPEKLRAVAAAVNRFPEVNHNDEREHRYNLWFVVTAGSEGRLQAVLSAIESAAGYPLLALPLLHEYHLDLAALDEGVAAPVGRVRRQAFVMPTALDEIERRLVVALQEGLPLFIRPFLVLASRVGCEENEVLERIRTWCAEGIIKRFGVIVRHRELGDDAMLVHDIPDALVAEVGERLARATGVSLCYQRPRVWPQWRYNLFCVIHGEMRAEVETRIAGLRAALDLRDYAHDILFSLTRFRQAGARHA